MASVSKLDFNLDDEFVKKENKTKGLKGFLFEAVNNFETSLNYHVAFERKKKS